MTDITKYIDITVNPAIEAKVKPLLKKSKSLQASIDIVEKNGIFISENFKDKLFEMEAKVETETEEVEVETETEAE